MHLLASNPCHPALVPSSPKAGILARAEPLTLQHIPYHSRGDEGWPSRNPNSTPPSGRPATNCAAAWMPASTRTTSWSCCSSSTSATSTPAQPYAPITIPAGRQLQGHGRAQGQAATSATRSTRRSSRRWPNANKLSDMPDFNDPNKLGSGKEMVDRLTNLIAIFENPALDFSQEPRRGRRHPRRRLRIPDAALRHRERQEQGPVLHARRSQPHHGQGHRHLARRTPAPPPPSTTRPAARARCC